MKTQGFSWKGQSCLVTGAFGFVGTHLCRELAARGAELSALDILPDTRGTFFGVSGIGARANVLRADVRRAGELERLRGIEFDFVFHLAAQPISPLSNILPEDTIETNAAGTRNVAGFVAAQKSPPVFVLASSACWYGATRHSPLKEDDPNVEGEFKYSESKVLAERETLRFERSMPTVRCRFVNLYGPGDRHFSRVVPKTIRHLLRGEPPTLSRNDGTTVLDFMHVADAVSALLSAAERGREFRGGVFNFGVAGNNPRPTAELVGLVSRLFDGVERRPLLLNPVEPVTKAKYLDNSKAIGRLGWRPSVGLEEGLRATLGWYAENIDTLTHLEF